MTLVPSPRKRRSTPWGLVVAIGATVAAAATVVVAQTPTTAPAPAPAAPPAAAATPAPAAAPAMPPAEFGECQGCHSFTAGAGPLLGPNLFGVGGRKAGSTPDFDYSPAMKASGITWTSDTLQAFILDPAKTVPGNRMDYSGASDAATAKEVADYLMTLK